MTIDKVKYLVCPNIVHHLSVQDYVKRYPKASVFGVPGLEKKRSDLNFTGEASVISMIDWPQAS